MYDYKRSIVLLKKAFSIFFHFLRMQLYNDFCIAIPCWIEYLWAKIVRKDLSKISAKYFEKINKRNEKFGFRTKDDWYLSCGDLLLSIASHPSKSKVLVEIDDRHIVVEKEQDKSLYKYARAWGVCHYKDDKNVYIDVNY